METFEERQCCWVCENLGLVWEAKSWLSHFVECSRLDVAMGTTNAVRTGVSHVGAEGDMELLVF